MWRPFPLHISFALLCILSLFISGCHRNEPTTHSDHFVEAGKMLVYETDTTEWWVCIVATGLLYADAVAVAIPDPYRLPTKEKAQVLKTCTLQSSERFITSDGYTFGMPSASVSKVGAKTKYSVLGLHIRPTVIDVPF